MQPRGSHTASQIEKTFLCIMGGRDSQQYFGDTHMLDIESMTWSQIRTFNNPEAPTRMCNHLAAGIQSVPSSFLFSFGGQTNNPKARTEWFYRDKVDVLDCRSMQLNALFASASNSASAQNPMTHSRRHRELKSVGKNCFLLWSP